MHKHCVALSLVLMLAACATQAPAPGAGVHAQKPASLAGVEPRTLTLRDFRLESGIVLPEVVVAYETYGTLAPDGRNAVLVSHGNTSSFHAAGRYAPGKTPPHVADSLGWWDGIIGPGKAFDTDKYFVVSSNMLGGAYGTTGPRSIDPRTARPYGPDFPAITLDDMVNVQQAMLRALGVKHLVAVAGGSYGGFLTFQWGISHPDAMDGLIVVASSPDGGRNPQRIRNIELQLARDPNWNHGWYYDRGGIAEALTDLRVATLESYGLDAELRPAIPDDAARAAEIRKRAKPWAREFDGNSLVVQRKAMEFRRQSSGFPRIKAKLLYVLSASDKLFWPPTLGPKVMGQLQQAGVRAEYFVIPTQKGHSGAFADAAMFGPALDAFLKSLP